jgi:methyl-accepting chemotaxis protein
MIDQVEAETKSSVEVVVELVEQLAEYTSDLSGAAGRLNQSGNSVSTAATEALATMESASSMTEQLSTSIDGVAERVQDARAITDHAVDASQRASETIEALSRDVAEINEVTSLIAHITRQTGLLALNAGVEAARAGNEGLGFAVIAREVRSLAEQTGAATQKISALIAQIKDSTQGAVSAMDEIGVAIARVNDASGEIAESVKSQVDTTRAITSNVYETTRAVTGVTRQIQQVAAETANTRKMAQGVDSVCLDVTDKIKGLQKTLVKIVRTRSSDADRRTKPRFGVDRAAKVETNGKVVEVGIDNISEGGAKLRGHLDSRTSAFNLRVDGLDLVLPCRVVSLDEESANVQFILSPQTRQRLVEQLPAIKGHVASVESQAA